VFTDGNDQIKTDIVPWALPKEDIPFSVTWPNNLNFDKIDISVDTGLKITKIVNVLEHGPWLSQSITIKKLKRAENGPNYFGATVVLDTIPNELKISKEIRLGFYQRTEIVSEQKIRAQIFRPRLEIVECPTQINITHKEDQEISLVMKYSGFGDVNMQIVGRTLSGKVVTKGISHDSSFKLPPPPDFSDSVPSFSELFFYTYFPIESLNAIIGYLDNHPIENVKLIHDETVVEETINAAEDVFLTIIYSDSMGNTYDDIIPRGILITTDLYSPPTPNKPVVIPIRVRQWHSEPIVNIAEMQL
jgi:hypothetical protein